MGYWEEKQQYKEELEESDIRKSFCNVCGRKITAKNIKGRCIECDNVVCNKCGKTKNNKIVCSNCLEVTPNKKTKKPCYYCGRLTAISDLVGICNAPLKESFLKFSHPATQTHNIFLSPPLFCKSCIELCKKCGKLYCLQHIKNHKCIDKP